MPVHKEFRITVYDENWVVQKRKVYQSERTFLASLPNYRPYFIGLDYVGWTVLPEYREVSDWMRND